MPLTIDLWSDPCCPWCWIGKRRLEAALTRAAKGADAVWNFHAFELGPRDARPRPVAEVLAEKYGASAEDIRGMFQRVAELGAELGLAIDSARGIAAPTFDAHRLIRSAAPGEQAKSLVELLHQAHFSEGKDLSDRGQLAELAQRAGLDPEQARRDLAGGAYAADVEADEQRAAALEIRGVPFFVFNGRLAVSGAQSVETFLKALDQAG